MEPFLPDHFAGGRRRAASGRRRSDRHPSACYSTRTNFSSASFPLALAGFYLLGRLGLLYASAAWLTLGSLFFYGYWNPKYLLLLLASIVVNFHLGTRDQPAAPTRPCPRREAGADVRGRRQSRHARLFQVRQLSSSNRCGSSPGIDIPLAGDRPAARNLVLHLHADRLSRRHVPGQGVGAAVRSLRAVRHLLSRT